MFLTIFPNTSNLWNLWNLLNLLNPLHELHLLNLGWIVFVSVTYSFHMLKKTSQIPSNLSNLWIFQILQIPQNLKQTLEPSYILISLKEDANFIPKRVHFQEISNTIVCYMLHLVKKCSGKQHPKFWSHCCHAVVSYNFYYFLISKIIYNSISFTP